MNLIESKIDQWKFLQKTVPTLISNVCDLMSTNVF